MEQRTAVWIFWVLFVISVFVIVALQVAELVGPLTGWAIMFALFAIGTIILGCRYPGLFDRPRK